MRILLPLEIVITIILLLLSFNCWSKQECREYEMDTLQLFSDTLVGKRMYPQQLTDETYRIAKKKQVYCCLEINENVLFVVATAEKTDVNSDFETIGYSGSNVILQRLNELSPEAKYNSCFISDTECEFYNQYDTLQYWLQWNPESPTFVNIETSGEWTLGWCKIKSTNFHFGSLHCGMQYSDFLSLLNISNDVSRRYEQIILLNPQAVRDMWFYHYGESMNLFDDSFLCKRLIFKRNLLITIEEGNLLLPNSSLWKEIR